MKYILLISFTLFGSICLGQVGTITIKQSQYDTLKKKETQFGLLKSRFGKLTHSYDSLANRARKLLDKARAELQLKQAEIHKLNKQRGTNWKDSLKNSNGRIDELQLKVEQFKLEQEQNNLKIDGLISRVEALKDSLEIMNSTSTKLIDVSERLESEERHARTLTDSIRSLNARLLRVSGNLEVERSKSESLSQNQQQRIERVIKSANSIINGGDFRSLNPDIPSAMVILNELLEYHNDNTELANAQTRLLDFVSICELMEEGNALLKSSFNPDSNARVAALLHDKSIPSARGLNSTKSRMEGLLNGYCNKYKETYQAINAALKWNSPEVRKDEYEALRPQVTSYPLLRRAVEKQINNIAEKKNFLKAVNGCT